MSRERYQQNTSELIAYDEGYKQGVISREEEIIKELKNHYDYIKNNFGERAFKFYKNLIIKISLGE